MLLAFLSPRVVVPAACGVALLTAGSTASAAYQIRLQALAGGVNDQFAFIPDISVTENGGATTAKTTLSSPNDMFFGYDNLGFNNSSIGLNTTAAVLAEANGTWKVRIETADPMPAVYQYTANVSVGLPFAALPSITSADLVNNTAFDGTVNFALAGGSANYPGPASIIRARLFNEATSQLLETVNLPYGTTSWTPATNLSGLSTIRISLDTQNELADPTALSITNVVPLNPAASPGLSFAMNTITYTAFRDAVLTVPEPAGLSGLCVLATLLRRRVPRS